AKRCRRVAPARARGRSRGGLERRESVAEPRRGNGAARTRAARGPQPADQAAAYALPRRKPAHAGARAEIRRRAWLSIRQRRGRSEIPRSTPMSMMRELVADSTELATAMLDIPSQLAKRLEYIVNVSARCSSITGDERLMLIDNRGR